MNILLEKSFCFIQKATILYSPNTTCQNFFSEDSKQHLHSPYKAPKRQTKEGYLDRSPWGVSWAYLQRLVTGIVVSGKSMGNPKTAPSESLPSIDVVSPKTAWIKLPIPLVPS